MKKFIVIMLFSIGFIGLMMTSCVTSKSVRYLRDMPTEGVPLNDRFEATIAPYDELRIFVMQGKDEELVKPFNVLGSAGSTTSQTVWVIWST